MPTINMVSAADSVKGQGVGSCYEEQVNLVREGLKDKFKIFINNKSRCDITHYHTINPSFFLRIPFNKRKGATVGYVHFVPSTIDGSIKLPWIAKLVFYKYIIWFYNSMDYLVTVNPCFIKTLEEYNINPNKVTYIANYVSCDEFHPIDKSETIDTMKKFNIPQDKFIVIGVGQIQTRKGVKDFVDVAKKMKDVHFVWVGGFSFGSWMDGYKELKQIVDNPPSNVTFTDIVDRSEMNDFFNIADTLFLPSFTELFPMTILESMCCHIPILLRDIDVYPGILFDFYCKADSVDGFVEKIYEMKNDPSVKQHWVDMSIKGNDYYSKDSILKMWDQFYSKVYDECSLKRQSKNK